MELRWAGGTIALRCPVCGDVDDRPLVATVSASWKPDPYRVARCDRCGSILLDELLPTDLAYTGEHWDWDRYLELQGAVEAIAETVSLVQAPSGARMLDVGCGFGFALDIGVRVFGWSGIGLDPSPAAARGRQELGLDIRAAYLDPDFAPGERFDVVVASEVLEHVPEPAALLREIAARLEPDGAALLTVPNGALITPDTPVTMLYAMLSVGHHVFLPTPATLEALLADAGLVARISLRGHAICAVASPTEAGLARANPDPGVATATLATYCADHAEAAPADSALGLGMAARAVKFLAYDGRFDDAAEAVRPLRDRLLARHGVDLDDAAGLRALHRPPPVLALAGYFAGVTARYVDQDPDLADARWTAAARAAQVDYDRDRHYEDPEVPQFQMQSLGELALLHAPTDPRRARRRLQELEDVARQSGMPHLALEYPARAEAVMGPEPTRREAVHAGVGRVAGRLRRLVPGRGAGQPD